MGRTRAHLPTFALLGPFYKNNQHRQVQVQTTEALGRHTHAPAGLRSRNLLMGDLSPSGCSSSILVFGSSTNTTVTPCSGTGWGSDTCSSHQADGVDSVCTAQQQQAERLIQAAVTAGSISQSSVPPDPPLPPRLCGSVQLLWPGQGQQWPLWDPGGGEVMRAHAL